jgi:hypothetical protein
VYIFTRGKPAGAGLPLHDGTHQVHQMAPVAGDFELILKMGSIQLSAVFVGTRKNILQIISNIVKTSETLPKQGHTLRLCPFVIMRNPSGRLHRTPVEYEGFIKLAPVNGKDSEL